MESIAKVPFTVPGPGRPGIVPVRFIWNGVLLVIAVFGVPYFGNDYWLSAILIPWLVLSLAGLGLNILTGYAGQLSLGSSAFMAVGAYVTYNAELRLPGVPLLVAIAIGGLVTGFVGLLFGLPSFRIRGFYLIVSTLAAQFLIPWLFTTYGWFSNDNASGVITAPPLTIAGHDLSNPKGQYLLTLSIVAVLVIAAYRLINSPLGRSWMAVRDMETAAGTIGIPVFRTKLAAFAVSSFYLGIAGALWAFAYLGTVEPDGFDLSQSFQILFIIIIGGLGSIRGNFLGAAFIVMLPIFLNRTGSFLLGQEMDSGVLENLQKIVFGSLIIVFLIKEPDGLSRLLGLARERLRIWPFRY